MYGRSGQQVFDPLELERLFDSQATTIDDITEEWFLLTQNTQHRYKLHSAISKEEDIIELQVLIEENKQTHGVRLHGVMTPSLALPSNVVIERLLPSNRRNKRQRHSLIQYTS